MCLSDKKGSPVLQQAEVELIDQTVCVSTYGIITSRMLCAGVMSGKSDACKVSVPPSPHLACCACCKHIHISFTQFWGYLGQALSFLHLNCLEANYDSVA